MLPHPTSSFMVGREWSGMDGLLFSSTKASTILDQNADKTHNILIPTRGIKLLYSTKLKTLKIHLAETYCRAGKLISSIKADNFVLLSHHTIPSTQALSHEQLFFTFNVHSATYFCFDSAGVISPF